MSVFAAVKKINYQPLIIIVISLITFVIMYLISIQTNKQYYINLTPSEPLGIYKKILFDGKLKKGELVIFKVPDAAKVYVYGRGWLKKEMPLLKEVRGIAGDQYTISSDGLLINGDHVGQVSTQDSQGKPLPKLRGRFVIKTGYFLPISTYSKKSFDGRYFGVVSVKSIIGKAIPFWTIKTR